MKQWGYIIKRLTSNIFIWNLSNLKNTWKRIHEDILSKGLFEIYLIGICTIRRVSKRICYSIDYGRLSFGMKIKFRFQCRQWSQDDIFSPWLLFEISYFQLEDVEVAIQWKQPDWIWKMIFGLKNRWPSHFITTLQSPFMMILLLLENGRKMIM